ncbi:ImpA family protein [Trabulsiella guamensis ATCC 49490]|uniref:ImpA family protein n=1 Tax=Trabulsiella guamensis ATCC 49490 TaxID=1005994 RepID=A0A085A501_9ENTR|nr:type VI secretion system protein TssA [Trabulsiella guamensis]KFC05296.1 ImpA family protein [Trabulsiella guamensis ATCC 49490]
MAERHDWLEKLATPLPGENISTRLSDDNPHWAFIDGEMVKLGALTHSTLNMADIQQRILLLLTTESKDFRLIVHLLRTLQHSGQPADVALAMQLLCRWVELYWSQAWPDNALMRRRLSQQVIRRFPSTVNRFITGANPAQRQAVQEALSCLEQFWQVQERELAEEIKTLQVTFARQPERPVQEDKAPDVVSAGATIPQASPGVTPPAPTMQVVNTDEKAWRHTQLQMAGILYERQPENPLWCRLRRNAIWQGITVAPQSAEDGRTPLAAFSVDRMAEYQSRLVNPDSALWMQVEESLTLAPYWFDGHHLSAQIAQKLGYARVASAIHDELSVFLQRLPQLRTLSFINRTPFFSVATLNWLEYEGEGQAKTASPGQVSVQSDLDSDAVWQSRETQGLEVALRQLDDLARQRNPRGQFYCQLLGADLLEKSGLKTLAQQHYQHLWQIAQGITLPDWEPELITQLEEHIVMTKDNHRMEQEC